jgi:hypothetical protein
VNERDRERAKYKELYCAQMARDDVLIASKDEEAEELWSCLSKSEHDSPSVDHLGTPPWVEHEPISSSP